MAFAEKLVFTDNAKLYGNFHGRKIVNYIKFAVVLADTILTILVDIDESADNTHYA